jgi:serine/threonine protein kinase
MPEPTPCSVCGCELPTDSPGGLCPNCLLSQGLDGPDNGAAQAEDWAYAATTPQPGRFVPPDVRSLAPLFPQLELLGLLGYGGMGAVYTARQKKLDRLVALKIIHPDSASNPAFTERFNREARTLARLNHPHVVSVHDFGEVTLTETNASGSPPQTLYYFLMEYVDGVNLRQALTAGKLPQPEALAIVSQVCEALQYAHDEGVIHRDIKPENILLDQRGRVRIADFGLAKLASPSELDFTLTATHQVMGTPRYMAPEQMAGSHAVDQRADLYSLGAVLYEMLTGRAPVGHLEPPSQAAEVDARLDEIVFRALASDPDCRYQQASDLKRSVESLADATAAARFDSATAPSSTRLSRLTGFSTICDRQMVAAWRWVKGDGDATEPRDRERTPQTPPFPGLLLIVLATIGCLLPFAPWLEIVVPVTASVEHFYGGAGARVAEQTTLSVTGVDAVTGICVGVAFAAFALLLLMTSASHAPGRTRAVIMMVISLAALVLVLAFPVEHATNSGIKLPIDAPAGMTARSRSPHGDRSADSADDEPQMVRQSLGVNLSGLEKETTPQPGYFGALAMAVGLLVMSAIGVRHAFASVTAREPSVDHPTPSRTSGAPVANVRFSVEAAADVLPKARFHFGSLGYELVRQDEEHCVFQRGRLASALLETNIRLYPTQLTVRLSPVESGRRWVSCHWSIRLMGALVVRKDIRTLEQEGRQFEALFSPADNDGSPAAPFAGRDTVPATPLPGGAAPSRAIDLEQVRGDVEGPSLALMVVGMLFCIGHLILIVYSLRSVLDDDLAPLGIPGLLTGLGMVTGGWHLRSLSSRGWAWIGAIAAVIPVSPGWLISAPIGIWTIVGALTNPDVKQAFTEAARQRSSHVM